MKKNTTLQSVFGLIISFGFASLPISRWMNEFANTGHLVAYEIIWWILIVALLLYIRFVEQRPFSSISFRPISVKDVFIAVLTGVIIVAGLAGIYFVIFPALHLNEDQQVSKLISTPFWWRLISVIRAAAGEEIIFRGYGIERLQELTNSRTMAGFISWAVFTLDHVESWAWSHVFLAGFGGIILTILYLWRRKLWVNIIAHFIVDGASVLLA